MADSRVSLVVITDAGHCDYREGDRCGPGDYWADRPYDPVPDMGHLLWSQGYLGRIYRKLGVVNRRDLGSMVDRRKP